MSFKNIKQATATFLYFIIKKEMEKLIIICNLANGWPEWGLVGLDHLII